MSVLKALPLLVIGILHQSGFAISANILFYSALGSHSTGISQWPLVEALVEKGHNVTFLTPLTVFDKDPTKKSKVNFYHPKKLQESIQDQHETSSFYELRKNNQGKMSDFGYWGEVFETGRWGCELLYSDPEYVDWVKSNKFDLVILDTRINDCALGAIHVWKAKSIVYMTGTFAAYQHDVFGIPDETSSVHDVMLLLKDVNQMTFVERFVNALLPVVTTLYRDYTYLPVMEDMARKALGEELTKNMPSFKEMDSNINLVFLTVHYSYEYARSLPPNVIAIGGNVVSKEAKPLPKEIQEFLDASPNGFVYVSFGTVVDFTEFDKGVQANFINALAQFPETRFLWKSHKPLTAAPVSDNVMVAKWVPQQTVLAHKKIKAYITHSGMGSTVEAIHFNVPLVCLPVLLLDQDYIADMTVKRGAGIKVEIVDMKQDHLESAIREVLTNKKYSQAMSRLSAIFNDRPAPPLETAVWWTEYILRHENTNEFLHPPSNRQVWWKRRQIDVWLVASVLVSSIVILPISIIYCILKKLFSKDKTKLKKN